MTTIQFKAGKIYWYRWIGDSNLVSKWKVTRCTANSVWAIEIGWDNPPKRFKIHTYEGCEFFRPFGNYSMCPSVRADREVELVV